MRLKDRKFGPPGGWRYEEPKTGKVFKEIVKVKLIDAVTKHRMQSGIPVGDVEADIETWICKQMRPGICVEDDARPQKAPARFTAQNVISFAKSIAHVIKNGGVVSQGEANRRGAICLGCPRNTNIGGCIPCSGVTTAVYSILGAKSTPYDNQLNECGTCGCALKAKIWIPKPDLEAQQQIQHAMDKYPEFCWMRQSPQP